MLADGAALSLDHQRHVPAASAAWYHATMSVSFRVADVARATEPLREWPLQRATHDLLRTRVEACGAVEPGLERGCLEFARGECE